MAEAKITVSAQDLASAVLEAVNAKLRDTGNAAEESSKKLSPLQKVFDDLAPSTKTAGAGFSDMKTIMSDAFENPTAGAKQLVGALGQELAPVLGTVGIAAGVTLGAVAAVGGAMFELAEHAAHVGANLNDAAEKFGASVPAVSHLANAAIVAGGSIDQISGAMFKFQQNVGEHSDKVEKAFDKIGLSLDQVLKLEPDKQFTAIAEALKNTEDPIARNSAGAEIFGKQFRDMAPFILKVNEALAMTAGIQPFTDEEAKASEQFEMQWATIKLEISNVGIAIGRELIPMVTGAIGLFKDWGPTIANVAYYLTPIGPMATSLASAFHTMAAAIDLVNGNTGASNATIDEATRLAGVNLKAQRDLSENGYKATAMSAADLKDVETTLTQSAEKSITAHKELAKQQTEWGKVMAELNSVGGDFSETLNTMSGEVVEAVRYYLEAGVSQAALAKAYGLTAVQVKAVVETLKEEKAWIAEVDREHAQTIGLAAQREKQFRDEQQKQIQKSNEVLAKSVMDADRMWNEYYDLVDRDTLSTTDYQIAQVQRWYDEQVRKATAAGITYQGFYDALDALAQQKMHDVYEHNDKYAQDTKKLLADLTTGEGGWIDTFSQILVHSGSFKDAVKGVWDQLKGDTLNVFSSLLSGIIHSFLDELLHQVEVYVARMLAKLAVLKAISFFGAIFGFEGGGVVPDRGDDGKGFASGGVVYAADGWPFAPRGSDTVPAMLTPGEGVLTVAAVQRLGGPAVVNAINRNDRAAAPAPAFGSQYAAMLDQMRESASQMAGMRTDFRRFMNNLPTQLRAAVILGTQ